MSSALKRGWSIKINFLDEASVKLPEFNRLLQKAWTLVKRANKTSVLLNAYNEGHSALRVFSAKL